MSGFVSQGLECSSEEDDVLRDICAYLRSRGIHDAIIPILLSSGIGEAPDLSSELLFLQHLVLKGQWEDTLTYLAPFRGESIFNQSELIVLRQMFLELISSYNATGRPLFQLPDVLSAMQEGEEVQADAQRVVRNRTLSSYDYFFVWHKLTLFFSLLHDFSYLLGDGDFRLYNCSSASRESANPKISTHFVYA